MILRVMGMALVLATGGCVSNTSWKQSDQQGPWCAPGRRAVLYTRMHDAYMLPGAQVQEAWSTGTSRKRFTSFVEEELNRWFGPSPLVASWPATGGHIGEITQRKAPFDLYLVAIDPIVLVGVPGTGRPPAGERTAVFSPYLHDLIPVATELHVGKAPSVTILRRVKGALATMTIGMPDLPSVIELGRDDYLILAANAGRLVVSRTNTVKQKDGK